MPDVEDLRALWEMDLELAGSDQGPIPIVTTVAEKTWVWSDLHLGDHGALQAFDRPFGDVDQMNRHLLWEWRRRVRSDDTIICLGDVAQADAWRDRRLVLDIRDCPGKRVLVLGNHDLNRAALREAGFTKQCSLALCATDPPLALSHYPLRQIPAGAINLHGHLHEGTEPTRRHIKLAVEQTDYGPVGLIWVLGRARQRQLAGQSIQGGSGSEAPQRTERFGRPVRCHP